MNLPEEKKHGIFGAILTALLLYIAINVIYAVIITTFKSDTISYLITYVLMLFICFTSYKDFIIKDAKRIFKTLKKHWVTIILSFLIFTLLTYLSNYIIYKNINSLADQENSIRELIKNNNYIMVLITGILVPIVEELMIKLPFRNNKRSKKICFIIYTLIFAALHLFAIQEPIQLLYMISYTFMSLSFSYSYYKTNNICVPIILHILNNLISISIILIGG